MNKFIPLLFAVVLSVLLSGCGKGDVSDVKIYDRQSVIYSDWEIRSAAEVAVRCFKKEFHDCTLLEMGYAGDENGKHLSSGPINMV